MNLSQLYYFQKLAEMQHYTKAAKALFITQPSLSDSIASLEKELGVQLFKKKGRNIELTKSGREFYDCVSDSLGILEHGIAMLKESSGGFGGAIDIGCIPTCIGDFLSEAIEKFHEQENQTNFNIYNAHTMEILNGVQSGRFDLGICSRVDNMPDLAFVPLFPQDVIAAVRDDHPLAKKNEVKLSDLKGDSLISYRLSIPVGKVIQKLLEERDMSALHAYDDEISIGGRVMTSSKVAIMLETPFLAQFSRIKKLRLSDVPRNTRIVYLVYNKKAFITSEVEAFSNFVVSNYYDIKEEDY